MSYLWSIPVGCWAASPVFIAAMIHMDRSPVHKRTWSENGRVVIAAAAVAGLAAALAFGLAVYFA